MSRWVTFYYDSIDDRVEDLKVHPDKESALKYFNQNHKKYFATNIRFKADKLPCSYGYTFRRYYGISAQSFKKQFGISIDEVSTIYADKGDE